MPIAAMQAERSILIPELSDGKLYLSIIENVTRDAIAAAMGEQNSNATTEYVIELRAVAAGWIDRRLASTVLRTRVTLGAEPAAVVTQSIEGRIVNVMKLNDRAVLDHSVGSFLGAHLFADRSLHLKPGHTYSLHIRAKHQRGDGSTIDFETLGETRFTVPR